LTPSILADSPVRPSNQHQHRNLVTGSRDVKQTKKKGLLVDFYVQQNRKVSGLGVMDLGKIPESQRCIDGELIPQHFVKIGDFRTGAMFIGV
jgi:hypothetical protein